MRKSLFLTVDNGDTFDLVVWEEGKQIVDGEEMPAVSGDNRLIKVYCGAPDGYYIMYCANSDNLASQTALALVFQFGPPSAENVLLP